MKAIIKKFEAIEAKYQEVIAKRFEYDALQDEYWTNYDLRPNRDEDREGWAANIDRSLEISHKMEDVDKLKDAAERAHRHAVKKLAEDLSFEIIEKKGDYKDLDFYQRAASQMYARFEAAFNALHNIYWETGIKNASNDDLSIDFTIKY